MSEQVRQAAPAQVSTRRTGGDACQYRTFAGPLDERRHFLAPANYPQNLDYQAMG